MSLDIGTIAGWIAGFPSTAAFALYIYSTYRGKNSPNRATWWILTVVGFMLAGSYYSLGARHTIWLAVSYAMCPLIVALVSLRHGEGGWSDFDQAGLAVAGLSAVLWWLCRSPLVALLINLFIDFVGLLPTIRKSFFRPAGEDRIAWTLSFAVDRWEFAIVVYAIYMVAGNGLIAALLYAGQGGRAGKPAGRRI